MPSLRADLRSCVLTAAIGFGVIAGCSEESAPSGTSGTGTSATAAEDKAAEDAAAPGGASSIEISVTADKTHAVQPSDEIRIEVTVVGFVLDSAQIGSAAQPGAGHYHVYLGGPDSEPLLVSADSSAVVKVPADVTDGTHTLRIQLRNHDHSPLDPPVETGVRLIIYRL